MYEAREPPKAQILVIKMKEGAEYECSEESVLQILKNMCFKYKNCNDWRKLLMEWRDTVAATAMLSRKLHEIRHNDKACTYYVNII
jgi:hypothetical protein